MRHMNRTVGVGLALLIGALLAAWLQVLPGSAGAPFAVRVAEATEAERARLALVIGNARYEALKPLSNPSNDAGEMAERLRALGFTLIGRDGKPTERAVLDLDEDSFHLAVKRFAAAAKRERAEIALVYYAGHGMQFRNGAYLLPVDVPKNDIELIERNSIALEGVLERLDGKAELTVAVFDACREIPELEQALDRGMRDAGYRAADFRGLARVRSVGRSRIVAYSAAVGQLAADGDGANSPYTELLLEALKAPDKEVGDLFRDVAWRMGRSQDGQQPELWIQGVPPDRFYFRPPALVAPPLGPVVPPPPPLRGYLQVSVNTEARITVAGRTVDTARPGKPLNLSQGLPVGAVEVAVSADGYADQSRRVAIPPNAWAQVHFELAAEPPPRAPYEPEMVAIPGGCFEMGSPDSEEGRDDDERQHRVCVESFQIGKYEVTQAQWEAVMGSNPSDHSGCNDCPVETISWNNVSTYIGKLNARTGKGYRLPTEAEWEYAARAGTQTPFWSGACIDTDQANYDGHSDYAGCGAKTGVYRGKTLPVGSLQANAWGLHDVAGNVWEWTCSAYDEDYGKNGEQRCAGKNYAGWVALRGGSWSIEPRRVRSANRFWYGPFHRFNYLGLRLAQD